MSARLHLTHPHDLKSTAHYLRVSLATVFFRGPCRGVRVWPTFVGSKTAEPKTARLAVRDVTPLAGRGARRRGYERRA